MARKDRDVWKWFHGTKPSFTDQDVKKMALETGKSEEEVRKTYESIVDDEIWVNEKYQVNIRRYPNENPSDEPGPGLIHLSIKRRDKAAIRDWRDFQRIKNELVGPEYEGVELYPAESRLVDSSNQYHVWVIDEPTFRFPFGFNDRFIINKGGRVGTGARQRARK